MKPLETVTGVGTESEKLRNYTNVLHLKRGKYKHVYTLEIIRPFTRVLHVSTLINIEKKCN